jgi:hypothetical protein
LARRLYASDSAVYEQKANIGRLRVGAFLGATVEKSPRSSEKIRIRRFRDWFGCDGLGMMVCYENIA